MAAHADKMAHLLVVLDHTDERASELDDSVWPDSESRERLHEVLAYARLVIGGSDGALVSHAAGSSLEATLTEFVNGPEQIAQEAEHWMERILDQLTRFPVGRDREFAQAAKNAAKTFERSARQRFSAVEHKTEQLSSSVDALSAELAERRDEISGLVEQLRTQQDEEIQQRLTQLDSRIEELQGAAERHAQTIETLSTEQSDAFRKAQDERADEYRERAQQYEGGFAELEGDLHERGNRLLGDIEAMKVRSAEMVGAIGITGTAGRYANEFDEQRRAANLWRRVTLLIGLVAAGVALWAAFDKHATTAGAKVAIAILIGGVGFYTARQSARHRHREEHARQLQLDLTAFPVFIEALPEDERNREIVGMVRRSFRGALPEPEDDDEVGLGAFNHLRHAAMPKDEK